MELTAKLIEEAEFRQSFRGYDVDQVDDFLEEVARGVEALQKQLDALDGGAPRPVAEAPAPAPAPVPVDPTPTIVVPSGPDPKALEDNTDELRRTLILAQRTADAAIREAREEAGRLVAEARDSSTRQVAEADTKAKKLVADAEAKAATIVAEAERQAEEYRTIHHEHLQGEITALEGTREQLRGDATLIDRHVEEQRQQLRSAVTELQRLIDDPSGFRLNPTPAAKSIDKPNLVDPAPIGPAPTAASIAPAVVAEPSGEAEPVAIEPESEPQPVAEPAAAAAEVTPAPAAPELTFDDPPPPVAADPDPVVEPEAVAATEPEPVPAAAADGGDDALPADTWSSLRSDPVVDLTIPDPTDLSGDDPDTGDDEVDEPVAEPSAAADDFDAGEPTQAVPELKGDADEDAFLAELRKAMTDDEPLGPRDDAVVPTRPTVDPLADNNPRSRPRFGRRR